MKENENNYNNYDANFEEQRHEYQNIIEEIICGDYLQWLEQFTKKHPNFTDIEWIYLNEKLTKTDSKNIKMLYILYEIISLYTQENYLSSKQSYTNSHIVKKDNFYFEIGKILDEEPIIYICSCGLIQNIIRGNINFDDIRKKYNQSQKSNIVAQIIRNLINENNSLDFILPDTHKLLSKQIDNNHKL